MPGDDFFKMMWMDFLLLFPGYDTIFALFAKTGIGNLQILLNKNFRTATPIGERNW
jgi:hypothetical protein